MRRVRPVKRNVLFYLKRSGLIFVVPFFATFFLFSFLPMVDTIRYSFYEYYKSGLTEIGPNFAGFQNYVELWRTDLLKFSWNTLTLWLIGFIPQITMALLLAAWFTDKRLEIRGQEFFKTVIYLPNVIMASAFAMLFFTLFSNGGPINSLLVHFGIVDEPVQFLSSVVGTHALICMMNFLMWFGNTTIMLMAAIGGINPDLLEAAEIDGCTHTQVFWKVTIPVIRPVFAYILITAMIGGLQMYDVPQILTNGTGSPNRTSMTLIMYLNRHLTANNYGMAGALSVYLFLVSGVLCFVVYRLMNPKE